MVYDYIGKKTIISQVGFIITFIFFLLILKEIKVKTFSWTPKSFVVLRHCACCDWWLSQPC